MSGGGQQTSQQTTQQILSPEQQQLLNMAMPFASKYAQNQPTLPTGSSVAGFTDPQKTGQAQTLGAAGPGGELSQEAKNAAGAQSFLTSGAGLIPDATPGLRAAIAGAGRPIGENLREDIGRALRRGGCGVD